MVKKVSKPVTPIWVWVVVFIVFIQLAKLAHRNDWFSNAKPNSHSQEYFKKLFEPKKFEKNRQLDRLLDENKKFKKNNKIDK